MKVVAIVADKGGCGHYRIRSVVSHLPEGVEVEVRNALPLLQNDQGQITGAPVLDADVIVYQRPTGRLQVITAMIHQARGVKIIAEFDDDLHALSPNNVAFASMHPKVNTEWNWKHSSAMVKLADLVTVSTDALAQRYGSHGRVVTLRNYIDADWLNLKVPKYHNVVGWAGTLANHEGDLRVTQGGVASVLEDLDAEFHVIGGGGGVAAELNLRREFNATPWLPFDLYPLTVSRFTAGIAPLADTAFNRAKSWLKPLEYAALGVPCVMSPLPEYARIHEMGVGLMATRGRDWRRSLKALLTDMNLREEMVARGREVATGLTMQGNAWRWAEAWESVLDRQPA